MLYCTYCYFTSCLRAYNNYSIFVGDLILTQRRIYDKIVETNLYEEICIVNFFGSILHHIFLTICSYQASPTRLV